MNKWIARQMFAFSEFLAESARAWERRSIDWEFMPGTLDAIFMYHRSGVGPKPEFFAPIDLVKASKMFSLSGKVRASLIKGFLSKHRNPRVIRKSLLSVAPGLSKSEQAAARIEYATDEVYSDYLERDADNRSAKKDN